jgi:hypothetical protein
VSREQRPQPDRRWEVDANGISSRDWATSTYAVIRFFQPIDGKTQPPWDRDSLTIRLFPSAGVNGGGVDGLAERAG